MQLKHAEIKFSKRQFPISVICERIRTPENIGMIFRVCEAFGVERLYIDQLSPQPSDRSVKKISRNTSEVLRFESISDPIKKIKELRSVGYKILALEITDDSISLRDFNLSSNDKLLLVIGTERNGIDASILALCDTKIHIPMYGLNSSMNVVNSLSVCLYELTNKMLVSQ